MSVRWRTSLLFLVLGALLFIAAACSGGDDSAPSDESPQKQLSYLDAEGALWLVNADGSDREKLLDAAACGQFSNFEWSPDGRTFVC